MHKISAHIRLTAICLLLLLCFSCESAKFWEKHVFFITLHEVVPKNQIVDGGLVLAVRSADGSSFENVKSVPLITSAVIYKAEPLPSNDPLKFGLRIYLDDYGAGMWQEACVYHKGETLAVLVDGFHVGFTELPRHPHTEKVLDIAPLWNKYELKGILDNVEKNHGLFEF